jgi:DNA-directed RNA polymerase subunit RPC12/RpoP
VSPKYSRIQQGQLGCKQCGYKVAANKNRTPEKVAITIMVKAKLKPLEPYKGDGSKWKCKCMKCGNIVYPMLTNIKQKNGGCMYCAMKGIDFKKPAYLYLLNHSLFGALKVGVGNSQEGKKNDRIKRLRKYGWEVHNRWDFDTGAEAYSCEQILLNHLRKDLALPVYMTLDLMKETGGHTETVDADSITLLELEKIIKKVIKQSKVN